jgi:phenylpropionate dioxygenase-like ring-hydroxylating dioxygenase large terminal subunit
MKTRIPMEWFDASTTSHAATVALPPEVFFDPQFYEFELDAVWGRGWFCIGRATDIPNPGDYYTITVDKDPLLVVRQRDQSVRVLANVCQHRGQLMAEGSGNVRRIRCPMHSWVYDLSGQLLAAPGFSEADRFDKKTVCLPALRCEVWEGFVFAAYDPDIAPLAPRLERLKAQLANYEIAALRAHVPLSMELNDWNWKHYADECYHCPSLHGGSWGPMYALPPGFLDEEAIYNDAPNGIIAYDMISPCKDASPTRTGLALLPVLSRLTDQQRSRLAYVTVAPNLLIVAMPDKVKYFLCLPAGPTRSWYGVSWLYPETTHADPEFVSRWRSEVEDLRPVMVEDYAGWRRYQTGIESRFAPRGRLSSQEKVIGRFQDWLIARYRKAAAASS